jgi:hypothetical protein
VIVHPERKTVLHLVPEAITHQEEKQKKNCERNASTKSRS